MKFMLRAAASVMKALMSFVKVDFLGFISPNEVFAWLDPICNVGVKSNIYVVEMVEI